VVRDFVGHGIGRKFHTDPQVPHYKPDAGKPNPRMKAGMTFTIEPMINLGSHEVEVDDKDKWTVRTKDGCFEWTQVITDPDGKYEFNPLPPLEVTIAISKHNNPVIYKDFQKQGGRTINLTKKDSTGVDFIYIAPPSVGCGLLRRSRCRRARTRRCGR
jgi:hypothetical protein